MRGNSVLLIIGGGIAAYKSLELIRRLAERGIATRAILTGAGAEFVTPLSVSALTGDKVFQDLFSLTDEAEMGHIQLSRSAELVVVAPATADLMAKAATGLANDLASTALLATDKRVLMAPAMNVTDVECIRRPGATWPRSKQTASSSSARMTAKWPAANSDRGAWPSRWRSWRRSKPRSPLPRPAHCRASRRWSPQARRRSRSIRCASSPIARRASRVMRLPARLPTPAPLRRWSPVPSKSRLRADVKLVKVTTAREMLAACEAALPADVAVFTAAVADWRPETLADQKIKKDGRRPGARHHAERQSRHPGDDRP